ncbi:MAG TPA: DeoR/GlpR family DNA-binding transcription regulator [Actinomycetota bacterium]|nr:DeoR/GlpR family DNA-binding transcription regulator [Actinomycetota bacterium]
MYAEERRQEIALVVRQDGRGDVSELAGRFEVTPETIRRDLTDLERQGVLRRVHGGAIPIERFRAEPAIAEKTEAMAKEKTRIASAALEFVPDRGTALLDAGTTTLALARVFPDRELTVFTNAMAVGLELTRRRNLKLYLIGGRVRGRTLADVDDWALRQLADLRVDVAFIGTNGLTVARGLSTPDPAEAAVKREMCGAAQQVVVLADHTKVGEEAAVRFASIEEVDALVTDAGLAPGDRQALEEAGVEVVVA